jgi:hypothetical protein
MEIEGRHEAIVAAGVAASRPRLNAATMRDGVNQ